MADVIQFVPRVPPADGGRARILRRRDNFRFRTPQPGTRDVCDDLTMDHVDNGMPSDSPYCAPDSDPA